MADPEHVRSLQNAHEMIAKLAGHISDLRKTLAVHAGMHAEHSRTASEHHERIRKLEEAGGHPTAPVYKHTARQRAAMSKRFVENFRS